MNMLLKTVATALVATTALAAPALAQSATATADLNIRSGPGPQYNSIGFIALDDTVTIEGCLEGSKWCRVSYNGLEGWAYSDYLTAELSGEVVVLTERYS
jgi:uncharacterized protein YraI